MCWRRIVSNWVLACKNHFVDYHAKVQGEKIVIFKTPVAKHTDRDPARVVKTAQMRDVCDKAVANATNRRRRMGVIHESLIAVDTFNL